MTNSFQTEIVVDPDVPLVRIIREFAAPRAKVFLAHTDPALVAQWNGPNGAATRITGWDCRSGGSYRYAHIIDAVEYGFRGCFHEVLPDELIIQTFTFEGMADAVALEKLVFEATGDGHTRLTATSLVDSFADRDVFVASGMYDVREIYERLDAVLAQN